MPTNGTIQKSTREGKKAMVYMDGSWHHFGDSSMGHNYSESARKRAYARHKKNLQGSDARAKANRVYWKEYWEKGGSVKKPPTGNVKSHTRSIKGKSNTSVRSHKRKRKG